MRRMWVEREIGTRRLSDTERIQTKKFSPKFKQFLFVLRKILKYFSNFSDFEFRHFFFQVDAPYKMPEPLVYDRDE